MTGLSILAGAVCGVLSALGVGGGSLLMVWLTGAAGLEQKTAQAVNLLFFLPTAAAGLILHIRGKLVLWRAAVPAMLAGAAAAALAAWCAASLEGRLLRKIFGGFLVLVGLSELFRKKGPDGPGSDRQDRPPE